MAEDQEEPNSLIHEERHKNKATLFRFLKPCTTHLNEAIPIPNKPLLSDIFPQNLPEWPSKVLFRGWRFPQKKWKEWADRLSLKYSEIWKEAGIHDAIQSSHYVVPRNQDLVLGLSEFWCPETNTFVFPWGEATVTLEDIMILGGLSVIGEPVITTTCLDTEALKIKLGLEKERSEICRSKAKKADQSAWMNHFMDKGGEFEHAAFLSLWLSRYVFPLSTETVGTQVFPVAVRLSRGAKVALAPAVLASIYRDLGAMSLAVLEAKENVTITGPFQFLQLWAFEHFLPLGPKSANSLKVGEPRVARWHKLMSKVSNLPLVRSALRVDGNFKWRPYVGDLENWRLLSCYRETKWTQLFNKLWLDEEMRSFCVCLRASKLVGLDCEEKYFPHRVAMQFGFDQDLPSDPEKFNFVPENVKFLVPPWNYCSSASDRHTTWWETMMVNRKKVIKGVLKQEKYAKITKICYSSGLSNHGNPRSCPPAPEKFGDNGNAHTATKKNSNEVHDHPPGFSTKYGSTSYGKRNLCDEFENVVPLETEKIDENRGKRKSRDVDGRTATGKTVKTEVFWEDSDPIYIDLLKEEAKLSEKWHNLGIGVAAKEIKAGETSDNPITIDDSKEYSAQTPRNSTSDIEERLAKLEKMVGVKK